MRTPPPSPPPPSDLPVPTDSRVTLREVPENVYLVHQFSGNMGSGDGHDAIAERERMVAVEKVAAEGGGFSEYVSADSKYLVARCVFFLFDACRWCDVCALCAST